MKISNHALHAIQQHAEQGYPSEVVGVLAGDRNEQKVSKVAPLVNLKDSTPNRYRADSKELWRVEQNLEDLGFDILGYYHSHPDHPSQFSQYDKDLALPNMNYLIISVHQGNAQQIQTWRLRDDRSTMDEIHIQTLHLTPSKGESHDH